MRHFHRTTLPGLDATEALMVAEQYRLVDEFRIPEQFPIAIWQRSKNTFAVTYGLQLAKDLSYAEASYELGECLLHAMSCAGKIKS
jgi:hypothetical protein